MFPLNSTRLRALAIGMFLTAALWPVCSSAASDAEELQKYKTAESIAKNQLAKFDTLDFDVFSKQDWDRLKESHAPDIVVHWPDGHTTKGLKKHTEDLKAMFVYAPDTKITEHSVKIGSGEWTSVIGVMKGTFTKPMPIAVGKTIAPNGEILQADHVHGRPLDESRRHGPGIPFLGQRHIQKQLGIGQ